MGSSEGQHRKDWGLTSPFLLAMRYGKLKNMKAIILSLLAALTCEAAELVWYDEFDGTTLNTEKWNPVFQSERHDAICTAEQVRVHNGNLWIRTETKNGKHYTGMIYSKFESAYGYWEIRAKMNDVRGTWSDAWLYNWTVPWGNYDINKFGMEVDIFEHRAVDETGKDIHLVVNQNLHWNGYDVEHQCKATQSDLKDDGFHVYGLKWTKTHYEFFIDGKLTWIADPVTSCPLFLVLSTEVKNKFWAGEIAPEGIHADTLIVDYVRYYR